mmetsp:Transcript_32576/g.52817  ORF Transcript_32576/g.52817 Transcript_32576/m.52817 type:complete len:203 (+) Transcript_32576:1080-1688(+)
MRVAFTTCGGCSCTAAIHVTHIAAASISFTFDLIQRLRIGFQRLGLVLSIGCRFLLTARDTHSFIATIARRCGCTMCTAHRPRTVTERTRLIRLMQYIVLGLTARHKQRHVLIVKRIIRRRRIHVFFFIDRADSERHCRCCCTQMLLILAHFIDHRNGDDGMSLILDTRLMVGLEFEFMLQWRGWRSPRSHETVGLCRWKSI